MAKNASGRTNTALWVESQERWRIRVTRDGVTKAFYCSTPGRRGQAEANRQADEWLLEGCPSNVRSTLTVGTAMEQYRAYCVALECKKRGIPVEKATNRDLGNRRQAMCYLEGRSAPIAGKRLTRITDGDLQAIIDTAAAEGKARKTLQNIRAAYFDFFKWCRRQGLTDYSPEEVQIPQSARNRQKVILQPEHLRTLFEREMTSARGKEYPDPLVYAYRLEVLTGLRPGELMALRWQDWDGDVLHVRGSINDNGEKTLGKNENALRDIQLFPLAVEQLRLHSIRCGQPSMGYMFSLDSQRQYRDNWYLYCTHNGIPHITPYELRHTFVSICQRLPEGMVKAIVGHSRSMDTFGIYGHQVDGYGSLSANLLAGVFSDIIG